MKICHVTSAHNTNDVRVFRKECTSLAQNGYDVYLVGCGESREENGVHVIGVGEQSGGRLSRMTTFAKKVYRAALEVDAEVYHLHDPELMPYGVKLKKKGKKVIFDSHEIYAKEILNKEYLKFMRKPIAKVYSWYEAHVFKKMDALVVVTPQMKQLFAHLQSNICMVANFPELKELKCDAQKEDRSICFAGGIKEEWNHETVIKAIEGIPNVKYNICGPLSEKHYLTDLQALPAWSSVNYMGIVTFERVQELLRSSSIGVALLSPSGNTVGYEGTLGNTKLFEMMLAGLPVICTDFVLWKEFVERYECGICVRPNDVEATSKAMRFLLDNPDVAEQMGKNGYRAIKEEFNWSIEEKKLIDLYKNI